MNVESKVKNKGGRPPKVKGTRKSSQASTTRQRQLKYQTKKLSLSETSQKQLHTDGITKSNSDQMPQNVNNVESVKSFMPKKDTPLNPSVLKKLSLSETSQKQLHTDGITKSNLDQMPQNVNNVESVKSFMPKKDTPLNPTVLKKLLNKPSYVGSESQSSILFDTRDDDNSDNDNCKEANDSGMPVDFEVSLKSKARPDKNITESDNDQNYQSYPCLHDDSDEIDPSLKYDEANVGFTDRSLLTPDPLYRSALEVAVYLTAMVKFAVEKGRWRGIGILDPVICGIKDFEDVPARSFMRGYKEHPQLILHPALFGAINRNVGHWILIAFNVDAKTVTLYDPLKISMMVSQPADHYLHYCESISTYLQNNDYLHSKPIYVHPQQNSYNLQRDGYNCGVHIVRIAEEISFTGLSTELYPFDIDKERNRMLQVCRHVYHLGGLPSQWPATLQSLAFQLPQPKTRIRVKTLINVSMVSNTDKNSAKKEEIPLPAKIRRSSRPSTQTATMAATIDLYREKLNQKMRSARKHNIPIGRNSANILPLPFSIGSMSKRCKYCNARLFKSETSNRCCAFGTVPVPDIPPYPLRMEPIFKEPMFWKNIRALNAMFAMVAVSADVRPVMDIFVVSGEFKYGIGDILPQNGIPPRFQQNYVIDTDAAVTNRLNDAAKFGLDPAKFCDRRIVDLLEATLRELHPLPKMYFFASELYQKSVNDAKLRGEEAERVYLVWHSRKPTDGTHQGQYSAPIVDNTMFKIWRSSDGSVPEQCLMIAVQRNNQCLRSIPYFDSHIDPAAYPLMFLYGQQGWVPRQRKLNPHSNNTISDLNMQNSQKLKSRTVNTKTRDGNTLTTTPARRSTQLPTLKASNNNSFLSQPATTVLHSDMIPTYSDVSSSSDEDDSNPQPQLKRTNPYISARSFYMAQTYDRTDEQQYIFHPITGSRKLSQVRCIDVYTRIEAEKLKKLQSVQEQLERRAERCSTLRKTLERLKNKNTNWANMKLGRIILLSHKYRGGPADMQRRYQNAVAINVRVGNGRSDLFVTFTGNPMWPEIQENLRTHFNPPEKWTDRPDLVNRVFIQYAKEFLRDVVDRGVLGKVEGYNYSVEHQKRGMPHIHLLLILSKKDRKYLSTAKGLDDLLSAQIPDKPASDDTIENELLREYADFVTSKMVHDPKRCPQFCGMNKRYPNICKKQYPKPFSESTVPDGNGYAELCRPDNGRFIPTKGKNNLLKLTNQHIVPHNRYLLLKYRCHINVESVKNIRSVKYLYKYSFKGHDRGFVQPVKALVTK